MRSVAVLLALALLGGCKREPDFDERFDAASKSIGQTARQIDAQVSGAPASEDAAGAEGDPGAEPQDADKPL